MRIGRAVSDACRASGAVRSRTVSGCPNGPRYISFGKSAKRCNASHGARSQKARLSIEWHAFLESLESAFFSVESAFFSVESADS